MQGAASAKAGNQKQQLEGSAQPAAPQGLPRPSAASLAASEHPQEPGEIASIAVTSSDGWDADNGDWNASGSGEAGWSFQEVSLDSPKARAARGRARLQARLPKQQTASALSNGNGRPEVLLAQLRQENLELRARLADVEGVSTAGSLLDMGFKFFRGLIIGLPPEDEVQAAECCIVSCSWMAARQQPPVHQDRMHSDRKFD